MTSGEKSESHTLEDLEEYRLAVIEGFKKNKSYLLRSARFVSTSILDLELTGSVLDSKRFTVDSDIDVAVVFKSGPSQQEIEAAIEELRGRLSYSPAGVLDVVPYGLSTEEIMSTFKDIVDQVLEANQVHDANFARIWRPGRGFWYTPKGELHKVASGLEHGDWLVNNTDEISDSLQALELGWVRGTMSLGLGDTTHRGIGLETARYLSKNKAFKIAFDAATAFGAATPSRVVVDFHTPNGLRTTEYRLDED